MATRNAARVRAPGALGDRRWLLAAWAAGWWLLARTPRPAPTGPVTGAVSVIIPARDEAASLPRLLASIAAQDLTAVEVIVVDDGSTDGTGDLARTAGATVVTAPPPPPGASGKPAACAAGAAVASGDILVFLDADVTLGAGALAGVAAAVAAGGGLVSVQPGHRPERPYERLSLVCNLVAMMGSLAFTGPPRSRRPLAFGPCLATTRADYQAAGGHLHPDVAGEHLEDAALSRTYRAVGRPVTVLAGGDVITFRMHPAGPRQMVDGWTRTLAAGARRGTPLAFAGPAAWVAGALVATGSGARALLDPRLDRRQRCRCAAVYAVWAAQVHVLARRAGRFGMATAVAFPVPVAAFVALFARSALVIVTGRRMRWRDRSLTSG